MAWIHLTQGAELTALANYIQWLLFFQGFRFYCWGVTGDSHLPHRFTQKMSKIRWLEMIKILSIIIGRGSSLAGQLQGTDEESEVGRSSKSQVLYHPTSIILHHTSSSCQNVKPLHFCSPLCQRGKKEKPSWLIPFLPGKFSPPQFVNSAPQQDKDRSWFNSSHELCQLFSDGISWILTYGLLRD